MSAANATLTEALALLRGRWRPMCETILQNRAVMWIGSGVSRSRFPDLGALLLRLLNELHSLQDPGNPVCPYRTAAANILAISGVAGIDATQAPSLWIPAARAEALRRLANNYADVLSVPLVVAGNPVSLAWDLLHLDVIYGDAAIGPDTEHRFLSLLVAEGAIKKIITTNWDALTEIACEALNCGVQLDIVGCTDDIRGIANGALILKIHGCAKLMRADPGRYKPYMVATRMDINLWAEDPGFVAIKEKVRTLLRENPAMFVGLSGQDFNLQAQWVTARAGGGPYPYIPPWVVFAEDSITQTQRGVLSALYREAYTEHGVDIDSSSAIPIFGKPLFGALWWLLILGKIETLLALGEGDFSNDEFRRRARNAMQAVEGLITIKYDAIADPSNRWTMMAEDLPSFHSRMLSLFRKQSMLATGEAYEPIDRQNALGMREDHNLSAANLHWLVLALALLLEGFQRKQWELSIPNDHSGEKGQLRAIIGGNEIAVFFLQRSDIGTSRLERNGVLKLGSRAQVLVIYPNGLRPDIATRSPGAKLPGSSASPTISELWLEEESKSGGITEDLLLDIIESGLISASPI